MPTKTESLLRDIVGKIEEYLELPSVPNMTAAQKSDAISKLQEIRDHARGLPKEFTSRHSLIFGYILYSFGNVHSSVSGVTDSNIASATKHLKCNHDDIRRHAYPDRNIQSHVLSSLDAQLDLNIKEWYGKAESLAVLVSLTGILIVIRAAFLNIGVSLNSFQIYVYCLNAIPVIWMAWDIAKEYDMLRIIILPAEKFFTHTELYEIEYNLKEENVFESKVLLSRRRRRRKSQRRTWAFTAILSIIITLTTNIC